MMRKLALPTAIVLLVAGGISGALAASAAATGGSAAATTKTVAATTTAKTVAATTTAPAAPATPALAPADIQSMFGTGSAFAAQNVGGQTYSYVLKPDGTASRTAKGSKTAEAGTWRAADPGYCAKWGKTGTERCYSIHPATAASTYDVLDTANKVIAHWTVKTS